MISFAIIAENFTSQCANVLEAMLCEEAVQLNKDIIKEKSLRQFFWIFVRKMGSNENVPLHSLLRNAVNSVMLTNLLP